MSDMRKKLFFAHKANIGKYPRILKTSLTAEALKSVALWNFVSTKNKRLLNSSPTLLRNRKIDRSTQRTSAPHPVLALVPLRGRPIPGAASLLSFASIRISAQGPLADQPTATANVCCSEISGRNYGFLNARGGQRRHHAKFNCPSWVHHMLVMSACPYYPTYLFGPTFFGGNKFLECFRSNGRVDGWS